MLKMVKPWQWPKCSSIFEPFDGRAIFISFLFLGQA
jgi:hypothetical protein